MQDPFFYFMYVEMLEIVLQDFDAHGSVWVSVVVVVAE